MQFNVVSQRPNGEAHIPTLSLNRHDRRKNSHQIPLNLTTPSTSFAYSSLPYSPRPFSLMPRSTSQAALSMSSSPSTPSPTRSAFPKPYGGMRFKHRPFRLDSTVPKRARSKIRKPNKYTRLENHTPTLPEHPSSRSPASLYSHSNAERETHLHDGVAKTYSFDRSPACRPMTAPPRAALSGNNGKEEANIGISIYQALDGSQSYPQRGSSLEQARISAAQAPPGNLQMAEKPIARIQHNEYPRLFRINAPDRNANLAKRSEFGRSRGLEQAFSQGGDPGKGNPKLATTSTSNNTELFQGLRLSKSPSMPNALSTKQEVVHTPNMHNAIPTCASGPTFSHREALDLYDRYKRTGTLSLLHDVIASISDYDDWHAYQTLIKAYIHGAARNDIEFADRMIDTLSDLLKPGLPADEDTISYLFTASNIPAKLLQFVVDRCMAAGKTFLEGQDLWSLPRAFICRALETTVNQLDKPGEKRLEDPCRYHMHHRPEQCYRLKEKRVIGTERKAGNIRARAAANTDHGAGRSYKAKDTQKIEMESETNSSCAETAADPESHVIAVAKAIKMHAAVPKFVVIRSPKPKTEAQQPLSNIPNEAATKLSPAKPKGETQQPLPNKPNKVVMGLSPTKPKAEVQRPSPNKPNEAFIRLSPAKKPVLIHNRDLDLSKHESGTVVRGFNDRLIRSLPRIPEFKRSDMAKDEGLRAAVGRRSLEAS